ncbi:MAG: DUF72 domain-containing protein [Sulfolobales archaeon]
MEVLGLLSGSVGVYVGTSGWLYDWNEGRSLDWYLKYSGLNAVELNASFYRFPFPNQVVGWRRKTENYEVRWAVKVHRSITHLRRLGGSSLAVWSKFISLFKPLDNYIDFYLIQMPPTFEMSEGNVSKLEKFAESVGLGSRLAVEFRSTSWFNDGTIEICRNIGATVVSIDSPIGTWVASSNGIVYIRLHGRTEWYSYEYTLKELEEIVSRIAEVGPRRVYVFFNNDHWMLDNARTIVRILSSKI